jgi:hypothetical protein
MSRNRTIYNVEALYVGPAPDSGYHFIDYSGNLRNLPQLTSYTVNLVKHIPRVQSVSYNIDLPYTNVLYLGKQGTVKQSHFEPPTINLNFEYLQVGVLVESRLGFYANYSRQYNPYSGSAYYNNNFNVLCIGGFLERSDERENNDIRWPYYYRDKRNIFVAINSNQEDINKQYSSYYEIDPNAVNWSVYAFGGCYLNSYNATATVGEIPKVSVSYVSDNITFLLSGSGAPIPAVDTKTFTQHSGVKFALPSPFDGDVLPAALLPGDIILDITSIPQLTGIPAIQGANYLGTTPNNYTNINNIGVDFTDIKIQNYSIELNLERKELKNIGHRLPIDRVLTFPLFVNTSITALVGDTQSGQLEFLTQSNDDFNITIKLNNPNNKGEAVGPAVRYDLLRSKLGSFSYNSDIGQNKTITLNFTTEIDPQDLTKGFFISGMMNTTGTSLLPFDEWVTETPENVVDENGENIVVGSYIVFY